MRGMFAILMSPMRNRTEPVLVVISNADNKCCCIAEQSVVVVDSCMLYYTTPQFTVQIISVFIVINKTRALISRNNW